MPSPPPCSLPPPPPAPWHHLFDTHLTTTSTTSFTLSTITHCPETNTPLPRARTCEFRGFFPNPPLHPNALEVLRAQGVGVNPTIYESDMISLTTDVRMDKVGQLGGSDGAVEGLFWVKEVGSQWRVRGRAHVIGDSGGGEGEERARGLIARGLRRRKDQEEGDWTWERQVTEYFANHSPVMRGSFKNPPPGQPRSRIPDDPALRQGQKVEDLRDAVARRNFRVVVIVPEEVERLDLSDLENVRRTKWMFVGDDKGGRWEEVELWP